MSFGGESKFLMQSIMPSITFYSLFINHMICTYTYRGSPNIEMDEHTFMVNRERAVDYLNSLDKVRLRCMLMWSISFIEKHQCIMINNELVIGIDL